MTDRLSQFNENARDIAKGAPAPDMSAARLEKLRLRIEAVPFTRELVDVEQQAAQPAVFDMQLPPDTAGRCHLGDAETLPVVALNPVYDDAKLASFYVHELSHLRQSCLADNVYAFHPGIFAEAILLSVFIKEADAYMRQSLFASVAYAQGDKDIFEALCPHGAGATAEGEARMLASDKAEDFLNVKFNATLGHLCGNLSLACGYFNDAMAVLDNVKTLLPRMTFEQLRDIDSLPLTGLSDMVENIKAIGTLSSDGGPREVNFLARENAATFFDSFFEKLPTICKKRFYEEKKEFVSAFYGAMDLVRPVETGVIATRKLWLPGEP